MLQHELSFCRSSLAQRNQALFGPSSENRSAPAAAPSRPARRPSLGTQPGRRVRRGTVIERPVRRRPASPAKVPLPPCNGHVETGGAPRLATREMRGPSLAPEFAVGGATQKYLDHLFAGTQVRISAGRPGDRLSHPVDQINALRRFAGPLLHGPDPLRSAPEHVRQRDHVHAGLWPGPSRAFATTPRHSDRQTTIPSAAFGGSFSARKKITTGSRSHARRPFF